jgi:tripartite-type tricarboxylate transporter receptor subunit TctC
MSSPAKTVREFVDHAKANPGKVTYASSGYGTSVHLSGELFNRMAGVNLQHIPYRGAGPAFNDLIPGRVDVMFNNIGSVVPFIQGGKLRALGVTSSKRNASLPDIPTVSEAGVPGFEVTGWYAFFAPARTPPAIVASFHADTVAALADPVIRQRLDQLGVGVIGSTPEELRAHLKAEMDKWGPLIKTAGIKVQ